MAGMTSLPENMDDALVMAVGPQNSRPETIAT
jgi:hypothetical protein